MKELLNALEQALEEIKRMKVRNNAKEQSEEKRADIYIPKYPK